MTKRTTSGKRSVALFLSVVMVFGLAVPVVFADDQLATPVQIPKGEPSEMPDGTPLNPAQHIQFRSLVFEPVPGATGYNVYAYGSKADAEADANRLAVAENVGATLGSQTTGGTLRTQAVQLEGDEILIDVRLIQFNDIQAGATRSLPAGYLPAGLGDAYFPGDAKGDTTNLKPGQYWFRIQAVNADNPDINSGLSELLPDGETYSIAYGPNEGRDAIEPLLAAGKLGTTPEADLRIVDLRGPTEFSDEGYIRFSDGNRITAQDFNTTEKAEALFGHTDDKSAVTIVVYCRGGGRSLTASRNLTSAGYTNVINMQGVEQWTLGLMYDDPTFRFRQVGEGEDGDVADPTNADSPAGISFDAAAGVLRWYNVVRAKYNIYAFSSADETDPANAVATGTLAALPQDLTGNGADWRFVRKYDLAALNLAEGTYYVRVQALPEIDAPVRGYAPETVWGTASVLSDAVEYAAKAAAAPPPAEEEPAVEEPVAEEPAVEEAAPAPVPSGGVYVVKSGDVLWKIAAAHGTTWQELQRINNLQNPHLIFPGQSIVLP